MAFVIAVALDSGIRLVQALSLQKSSHVTAACEFNIDDTELNEYDNDCRDIYHVGSM